MTEYFFGNWIPRVRIEVLFQPKKLFTRQKININVKLIYYLFCTEPKYLRNAVIIHTGRNLVNEEFLMIFFLNFCNFFLKCIIILMQINTIS